VTWGFARVGLAPIAGLLLVVLLCKTLERFGLAPMHRGSSVEEVIIQHQRAAAAQASDANLLFVGDSTCLMDLDFSAIPAADLASQRPLNLGTLSILPLSAFADLVDGFARRNPGRPASVVLLISPSMLEHGSAGASPPDPVPREAGVRELTSLHVFRDLFQRLVPVALPGKYGRFYGFDLALDRFMSRHGGSAVDPGELVRATSNPPIETDESLREACALFRAKLPRHCKLLVGLAPVPREQFDRDFPARHQELSSELTSLLGADKALRLPASYPAALFASTTHLKAPARTLYTRHVWKEVVAALNNAGPPPGASESR